MNTILTRDKIKELRKRFGMSQDDLARRLDVSRQTVVNWETGKSVPEPSYIAQMFKLFGIEYAEKDLLFGETATELTERDELMDLVEKTASLGEEDRLALKRSLGRGKAMLAYLEHRRRLKTIAMLCVAVPLLAVAVTIIVILLTAMTAGNGVPSESYDVVFRLTGTQIFTVIMFAVAAMIGDVGLWILADELGKRRIYKKYGDTGEPDRRKR